MREHRHSYRLELAHVVTPTPTNEAQVALAQLSLDAWALVWMLVEDARPFTSAELGAWSELVDDLEAVLAHTLGQPRPRRTEVH